MNRGEQSSGEEDNNEEVEERKQEDYVDSMSLLVYG
jgi:hypothetical protein